MKVLHVIHFPVFGGPHNQALRIAAPLADRGFETLVLVPSQPGNAADRLRAGGVDVRTMTLHRLRATADLRAQLGTLVGLPREVSELRQLIRAERIDLVQVGGLVNPHAAIAARLEHIPVIWQLLDTRAPRLVAAAGMLCVRELADVVMATGSAVAEAHPGYSAIADRVIPFFPPVDVLQFAPHAELKAEVRSEWGLSAPDLVVGSVANINPQKGIVDLVRAFASVHRQDPRTRLVLVGAEYPTHARYSAAVRAQMSADGLTEGRDVLFVGGRSDVERQLAGMDLVALAAVPRSEGITTAILEAMAAGLPVVVTDVGALREAVSDGRNGFVVQPGDIDALSNALARLLNDPQLRVQMGQEGRLAAVARFGVEACVDTHVRAYRQALAMRGMAGRAPGLTLPGDSWIPTAMGRSFEGVQICVEGDDRTAHDELDHAHRHKSEQARHFDRSTDEEFETERPSGTPRLYRFLLGEKFHRAIGPILPRVVGASALTVCGGSGMDAEYLARAGARVISSDLSLGAAVRAKDRAARHHLQIESMVADAEHLPFPDESVDLVTVHDGLHHLDAPFVGLAEMARVARRWVVVSEPAEARITRLAVRLGLALEVEEAGNRVARLKPTEVGTFLEDRGFKVLRAERYAMYYPHQPGKAFTLLSHPVVFQFVRVAWLLANSVVGRFGNKMVVVAERISSGPAMS